MSKRAGFKPSMRFKLRIAVNLLLLGMRLSLRVYHRIASYSSFFSPISDPHFVNLPIVILQGTKRKMFLLKAETYLVTFVVDHWTYFQWSRDRVPPQEPESLHLLFFLPTFQACVALRQINIFKF